MANDPACGQRPLEFSWLRQAQAKNKTLDTNVGDFRVTKPEWGLKRVCPSRTRYYDMKESPGVPELPDGFRPRVCCEGSTFLAPSPRKSAKLPHLFIDHIEDIAPIEGDGEEAVIEDAEELGDEDTELEEVVELEDDATDTER